MDWIKKHRLIVEGSAIVLGLLLAVLFIYLPLFYRALDLNEERKENEQKLNEEMKKESDLKSNKQKLNAVNLQLSGFKKQFALEKDTSLVIQKLNHLAQSLKLNISTVRDMPAITKGFYSEKPIEIQLEGDYQSIASFIAKAESDFNWFIDINEFKIQGVDNKPNPETKKMVLKTTIHTLVYTVPN